MTRPPATAAYPRLLSRSSREEGRCPECGEWSPLDWVFFGLWGLWWSGDASGCPACGDLVCVESECKFHKAGLIPSSLTSNPGSSRQV